MNEQKDQKNKEIRDALFPDCPIRNVLARVGDKWSLLVLYNLQHKEPMRFKEDAGRGGDGRQRLRQRQRSERR